MQKSTFQNVLFWSIISAAFIGPGTVTTASKAGASFGLALLWALFFSTIATIILQETAARITIASGKNLGEIIALKNSGTKGKRLKVIIFLAVALGCTAYQAGNMLGAVSGLELVTDWSPQLMTIILGIICAALLWIGDLKIIAKVLGVIVAMMGAAFVYVAFQADFSMGEFLGNMVVPNVIEGSSLLVIGLIGTTIVPYNLFLGSGISPGQQISEMRQGIIIAVLIGGLISMAIMVVGTQVEGAFSFAALAAALGDKLGAIAVFFFGVGLFAAGISSSITSPLAAAVTAKSLFNENGDWTANKPKFRLVWAVILAIGLIFGVSGVKPVPAIILAQAINGALLPIVASFLLLAANDSKILPKKYLNSIPLNLGTLFIVGVTGFLGMNSFLKTLPETINLADGLRIEIAFILAAILVVFLGYKIFKK